MNTLTRWDQSRGLTLQDEMNRLFEGQLYSRPLGPCRTGSLGSSRRHLRNRE